MLTFLLIQPGATDFDDQRRIKGTLDFPLSDNGVQQVAQMRQSLAETDISVMFSGPCRSAQETAEMIAEPRQVRVRVLDDLKNIDHGLWQGKLIEEIKRKSFFALRHEKPKIAGSAKLLDELEASFRAAAPLMRFLCRAVDADY